MSSDEDSAQHNREKFVNERVLDERVREQSHKSFEYKNQDLNETDALGPALSKEVTATLTESKMDEVDEYGPALPQHLRQRDISDSRECYADIERNGVQEATIIGPQIPQHLIKNLADNTYAPSMPADVKKPLIIGPELPEHLRLFQEEDVDEDKQDEHCQTPDQDNTFGPSPSLMSSGALSTYPVFSKQQKSRETENEGVIQRESWMLELPPEKAASFGLGPRQFRAKLGPDKDCDRSVWTDTPEDKERKANQPLPKDDSLTTKRMGIEERDKEMERLARKAEKKLKRKESLLELHAKKMKKKAKKEAKKREREGKPVERRPFDRDVDLQVNRFDESQKRAVLKKAQLLNDRFSQGESKFL